MSVETGSESPQNQPAQKPRPGVINLVGLNKAKVLAALYNVARPLGNGFMKFDPAPMPEEVAQELLERNPRGYFDYVQGRVMKVDLSGDELETRLFNRDNGPMAAENAIKNIT